jgi:hypothetical protein
VIGTKTSIADRPHRVTLENPALAVEDGDGGSTPSGWLTLAPGIVSASIRPPTAQDLERLAAGTVIATGARVITFPFHPQVTLSTRVSWTDPVGALHTASVTGVDNPEGRCIETVCLCVELLADVAVEDTSWIESGWTET